MKRLWRQMLCALLGHTWVIKTQCCKRCGVAFKDTEEGQEW